MEGNLVMRRVLMIALASVAVAAATPAYAAVVSDGTCTSPSGDTTPNATACTGYYTGNIFNNQADNRTAITAALAGYGVTYTGNIADYLGFSGLGGLTDLSGLFGNLTGVQVLGIHYGGGAGGGESAFYQIDFGAAPGQPLSLNLPASSNVYLFTTPAVPEPATWGLMLLGFAGVGMALRRSRRYSGELMQVA
jgi:hypothetical protein